MVKYCTKCGAENKDTAKYCINCGEKLNITIHDINKDSIPHQKENKKKINDNQESEDSGINKNILLIAIIIILCTGIIAGALIFTNQGSPQNQTTDTSQGQNSVSESSSSSPSSSSSTAVSSLKILSGSISTGSADADKSYCHIYVGSDHAGESVKMSALFSRNGNNLNEGKIVSTTVSSSGYVDISSAYGFKYYPDKVILTLYDASGNQQDQKTVYLSASSGTQTF